MKPHYFIFICLSLFPGFLRGQEMVYVNTGNLVLRDRPERVYNVLAVLRPTCPLTIDHTDVGYKNNRLVNERFYQVSFRYKDNKDINHYVHGWVEKKYMVTALARVNYPGADKSPGRDITELMLITDLPYDDKQYNAAQYPPPKYKGAEKQPEPVKSVYHKGPRGGCYYKNAKGKKVYVDKSLCK